MVCGIENHDVGEIPGPEGAAFGKVKVLRREGSQPSNRFFQRDDPSVAHVSTQQPREVSIGTWVRAGFQEHSLRRHRSGVRAEAHPGERDLLAHVVFGHQEVDDLHTAPIFDDEIYRRIFRRAATHLGHFRQSLPGKRLELVVLESYQQRALRARREVEVLPIVIGSAHLCANASPGIRILETICPSAVSRLPETQGGMAASRPVEPAV